MRCFSILGLWVLPACFALAGPGEGTELDYRLKVRLQEESAWVESGFRVVTTPALVTRNRVKKPRMGGWRVEPLPGVGEAPSAALLARVRSLLYFSGPSPQTAPRASSQTLGSRQCRLWQVQTPAGIAAYIYLAEVAPKLLALSYLSVTLDQGDIAAMEIHLVGVTPGSHPSPAQEGTTLLRTLQRWSLREGQGNPGPPSLESEEIN